MATESHPQHGPATTTGYLLNQQSPTRLNWEILESLSLGRDSMNGVELKDRFASSRHARVERRVGANGEATGFVIRDLRSRNGTFLNGARILEAPLQDGDRILIGETEFLFSSTPERKPVELSLTSRNPAWQRQLSQLPHLASTELPLLLQGPSGTGKDVLAQTLHRLSPRKNKSFVSVNCSALNESLIESELFGHVRGSFTGATQDRAGAFQSAQGGTLFLDEIGDLPLSLQPKLLRALENREVRPLGSDRVVPVNARVVSATHHDLRHRVRMGAFREDLYFRLNVLNLFVPPLKARIEDLEDLFYHFAKHHRVRFSFAAIQKLKEYAWPGNIRELRNIVARAKAYHPSGTVEPDDLLALFESPIMKEGPESAESPRVPILKELEIQFIKDRLIAHRGNQRRAAEELGMPKSTLHDRIRGYGIDIKALLNERGIKALE